MRIRLFLLSLILFCVAAANSNDPCRKLLLKYGSLQPVLTPRVYRGDLEARVQAGGRVRMLLGRGWRTTVHLETRSLRYGEPSLVVVKYMPTMGMARKNASMMRKYQMLKEQGLLPGFDVNPVIARGPKSNMFPFLEGAELISLTDEPRSRVPKRRQDPEVYAIWMSYVGRLNETAAKFADEGYVVEGAGEDGRFVLDPEVNGFPELSVFDRGQNFVVEINPGNIWVTSDGRFVIIDPF